MNKGNDTTIDLTLCNIRFFCGYFEGAGINAPFEDPERDGCLSPAWCRKASAPLSCASLGIRSQHVSQHVPVGCTGLILLPERKKTVSQKEKKQCPNRSKVQEQKLTRRRRHVGQRLTKKVGKHKNLCNPTNQQPNKRVSFLRLPFLWKDTTISYNPGGPFVT